MLTFKLEDGKQVEIEREALEDKLLEGIIGRLDEAREKDPGMYSLIKGAINTIITFGKVDIKPPKGVNSLDYLIMHYLGLGLDVLENMPLAVNGKVVEADVETSGLETR